MKPKYHSRQPLGLIVLAFAAAALSPFGTQSATAADYTWDGGDGTDDNWGSAANWNPDGAPLPGSTNSLIFTGTTRLTPVNNYGNGDDFQNITFDSTAGAFTISNTGTNGIDWFGSINNNSSNIQTIGFRLYQSASNAINATSGNITLNSSALLFRNGQALTLTAASGKVIQIDSVIADGGGGAGSAISVNGVGTVDLRGANTFTSGITLSSTGTLALGDKSALGTGTLSVTGAGFLQATTALTGANNVTNNITGAANLTINGSQNLELGGNFTSSGSNSRTLTVSNTGTTTLSGNVYLAEDNTTTGRVLTLNGAGATIVSGNISNNNFGNTVASGLTINNASATVTLSGANNYTGATTLSAGTVNVNSTTAFGATASTVALNGITLNNTSGSAKTLANNNAFTLGSNNIFTGTSDLNLGTGAMSLNGATRTWTVNGGTLTVGGNLTGGSATIGLTKAGVGTLKLAGAANGSIGALTVNGGIVDLGTDLGLLGGTLLGGTGGTINTSGGKLLLNVAAGDLGVANGGTLTINAVIANGTQNSIDFWNTGSGTGVVVLTASNTFSGTTNLQSGIISVSTIGDSGVSGNLGTNATFHIGATTSAAALRYTGTGETNNRVLNLSGTTGGATIEQAGTGLLKFTSNLTATGGGNKTLALTGSTAGTGELAGNIVNGPSGATTVAKTGTGAWTLSGSANSYTGGTRANAGTLIISGALTGNGFVSVNNVGAQNATLKVVSGATLGMADFNIGEAANSRAAIFQSGGAITVNANTAGAFRLGNNTGSYGYYNMSGGTLDLAGAAGEFNLGGTAQDTVGVMDMSGGTITTKSWILLGRGDAGTNVSTSSGLLNITGGTISHTSNQIALGWAEASGATNIINVGGGANPAALTGYNSAATSGNVGINLAVNSVTGMMGAVNLLTNGTLTVSMVQAGGANTQTLLNFNGGTLKATATNAGASFLTAANLDAAHVYSGGGTIDNNGTAITIGRALLTTAGTGITNIAVTNGGAGYIGAPLVEISGGTGFTGTAYANMVDDGTGNGTFKIDTITVTSNGVYSVAPTTVTLTGGGATTAATIGAITTGANVTTGGMAFTGTGTTTLTDANTYTGTTTIAANSILQLGSGATTGVLSASSAITNNGTLTINRSNAVVQGTDFSGAAITGTGAFIQAGGGTTTLNTANTFTGSTTLTAGTLSVADTSYLGGATANNSVVFNGGTLQVTGTAMTSFGLHVPTFTATKTVGLDINNAANTFTIDQALNQTSGGLTKAGAGTLSLTGVNTFTGNMTISGGTLSIDGAGQLNSGSYAGTISNAGTFIYNSSAAQTLSGVISGAGAVTKSGNGTLTLSTATNTFSGGLMINAGIVSIDNNLRLGGTGGTAGAVTLNGGTLRTTAGITNTHAITVGASGGTINVTTTGQYLFNTTNTLLGSGALAVTGNGTLVANTSNLRLAQTNTYSGAITINSGGSFEYGVNGAVEAGATFAIGNQGELAVQDGVTLGNNITVSGGTNSILSFENGTTGIFSGGITLDANATVGLRDWYNYATVRSGTISGDISGAGGLTVNSGTGSGGTLTLTGTNDYTGNTTISASTVLATKTASLSGYTTSGKISVGSTGTLAVNAGGTGEFASSDLNSIVSNVSFTAGGLLAVDTTNAGGSLIHNSNISGVLGLRKIGTGTLALGGTNTYSGVTTISAGTLEFTANTAMSSSSAMTLNTGGTLSLRADADTTFTPASFTGSNGSYTIAVNQVTGAGAGKTLTLANAFNMGSTGNNLTVSSTSGDTLLLSSQLALANSSGSSNTINLSGANMTLNAGVNFNGAANGPFLTVNANSNTLLINGNWTTGNNRWSGIVVNNGTVTMANGQNGGSSNPSSGVYAVLNGGTLNLNSNTAIGGGLHGNNFTINGGTLDNTSGSARTLGTPFMRINADFAFSTSGGTSANDLNLGTGAKELGTTAAGTGATRTITTNGSATLTVGGVITSNGATPNNITKAGTGTLVLTGNSTSTYLGLTAVQLGKLVVSGFIGNSAVTVTGTNTTLASGTTGTIGSSVNINNGAILAAGDVNAIGTATVVGATTFNTGSIFSWDLAAAPDTTGRGSNYDALDTASLGATTGAIFRVVLNGSQDFSASFWDTTRQWTDIFKNGATTLDFETIFSGGVQYYNGGGVVTGVTSTQGAFTISGSTLTWSAVPEPTSALAGLLLGAGLLRRRRKN